MAEMEPADSQRTGGEVVALNFQRPNPKPVSFERRELQLILNVYGRRVAEGEWRDYAIDFSVSKAVFSIFRRTSETPLFTIEKTPAHARRQGAYSVVAADGRTLKRGHDLERVLGVFEKKLRLVT
ncbi:MAG: DUF2794 domain-containing protein [Beijerinckiaceae bacterium]